MSGRLQRAAVAVGSQAVSSLGNVLLVVFVARAASAEAFGAFALAYAVYVAATGLSRSISSEPLIVTGGRDHPSSSLISGSLTASVLIGLVLGATTSVAGAALESKSLIALGVLLTPLLLHDGARMALLAIGRPGKALAIDSLWTGGQCVLFTLALWSGLDSAHLFVVAWGIAGTFSAILGCLLLSSGPMPKHLRTYWQTTRETRPRYALEFLVGSGALQAIHFTIAAFLGLRAVGALRAAQSVLGPFNQVLTALGVGLMPETVRLWRESPKQLFPAMLAMSSLGVLGVSIGTLALTTIPDTTGAAVLGETWDEASGVLVPAGFAIAGNMAIVGPLLGLRALAEARTSLRCRTVTSLATLGAAGLAILVTPSIVPVAWGITVGVWLGAAMWWISFRKRLAVSPTRSPLLTSGGIS